MSNPTKSRTRGVVTPQPYSRNRAAEVLGWSPRTLVRRTEDGVIARRPDGRFDRDEVERVLALALSDDDDLVSEQQDSTSAQALKMFQQAQGHTERMVKLLESPIIAAIGLLERLANSISARDAERDSAHLDFLRASGELFTEKTSREAMLIEATARAETFKALGGQLAEHAPRLLGQLTGGSSSSSMVSDFVRLLDDEDRAGMYAMSEFLEGADKKAAYLRLLETMGVKKPVVEVQNESAA